MVAPSVRTIKRLFGLSSNRCAFPQCDKLMVDASGTVLGEVCHIRGDNPGSKRYDQHQSEAERQDFDNLILLCPYHHTLIDGDEQQFTPEALIRMKQEHERSPAPFSISDATAEKAILLLSGVGLGQLARELGGIARAFLDALSDVPSTSKAAPTPTGDRKLQNSVSEMLRYCPRGNIFWHEPKPYPTLHGIMNLFKQGGWRLAEQIPAQSEDIPMLFFVLPDRAQAANAEKAIRAIFERLGFRYSLDQPGGQIANAAGSDIVIRVGVYGRKNTVG